MERQQHKWSNEFSGYAPSTQLLLVCSAQGCCSRDPRLVKGAECPRSCTVRWTQVSSTLLFELVSTVLLLVQKEWERNGKPRNGKAWQGIMGSLHIIFHGCKVSDIRAWCDSSNMKCHRMNISNTALSLQCQTHSSVPTNLFWMQIYSYCCEARMWFIFEYASAKL